MHKLVRQIKIELKLTKVELDVQTASVSTDARTPRRANPGRQLEVTLTAHIVRAFSFLRKTGYTLLDVEPVNSP